MTCLKKEHYDEEEAVGGEKDPVLKECATVAEEGDDEDESTHSYQDVGHVGQGVRGGKVLGDERSENY